MADEQTIVVPAALGRALDTLDMHWMAAKALAAAIIAINEHSVDIDDDAMAAIEQERFRHSVAADAIAEALQVICRGGSTHNTHALNASQLFHRKCDCGAAVRIEEVKQ